MTPREGAENPVWSAVRPVAVSLLIGTLGGALFAWIGAPLAWMLGAMILTVCASFAGVAQGIWPPLRTAMIMVFGVLLGSAFTPALLGQLGSWIPALLALLVFVPLATAAGYVFLRRVGSFDRTTAYFASFPGGLSEMVLLGEMRGGSVPVISLIHATRIVVAVSVIPLYFRFGLGYDVPTLLPNAGWLIELPWREALLLAGSAVVGTVLATRARLPAPAFLGPMIVSSIVHGAGWSKAAPPAEIVAAAQIVIGSGIGARFAGFPLRTVGPILLYGVAIGVLMIALTAGFALFAAQVLPQDAVVLFLAFAPGGLAEMMVIALALGIDPAFVSTMHLIRITFVISAAPAGADTLVGAPTTDQQARMPPP